MGCKFQIHRHVVQTATCPAAQSIFTAPLNALIRKFPTTSRLPGIAVLKDTGLTVHRPYCINANSMAHRTRTTTVTKMRAQRAHTAPITALLRVLICRRGGYCTDLEWRISARLQWVITRECFNFWWRPLFKSTIKFPCRTCMSAQFAHSTSTCGT